MFDKNYFVVCQSDKGVFDNAYQEYKNWFSDFIKVSRGLNVKDYDDLVDEKSKTIDLMFNKYGLLSNIKNTDEVSDMYKHMINVHNEFSLPLGQNKDYYELNLSLTTKNELEEEIKSLKMKSFEISGFNLPVESQEKLNKLKKELSDISIDYSENIIKSKKDFKHKISKDFYDKLTESEKQTSKMFDDEYYIVYNQNVFYDIMTNSENRELREIVFNAQKYPASKLSDFDNTEVTKRILEVKKEIASLIGYENYTDFALDRRMAKSYEDIKTFLESIREKVVPLAKQDNDDLNDFVLKNNNIEVLENWDRAFYANVKKEKQLNYKYKSECDYFPLEKVYSGVFNLVSELFGFRFELDKDTFVLPYKDTDCYKVYEGDKLKAYLIVDMYERDDKGSGAWVSSVEPVLSDRPGIVSLCCNINKMNKGVDLSEINTFLHEMGHAIHHFSSNSDYNSFSGTNGFARDAVEIPSQMLEQFAYNEDFLLNISSHVETNEKLPNSILKSLLKSKNYNIGSHYARQLVFALFDIEIYSNHIEDIFEFYKTLNNSILPNKITEDDFVNFPNQFGHIFSGGYSSGYYGYMWADIFSVDAYLHILKNPKENAMKFKNEFLSKGSSIKPSELYKRFKEDDVNISDFFDYYKV